MLSSTFQLRTYDWNKPPKRITLGKLVTEVGKLIQLFIDVRLHALLYRVTC